MFGHQGSPWLGSDLEDPICNSLYSPPLAVYQCPVNSSPQRPYKTSLSNKVSRSLVNPCWWYYIAHRCLFPIPPMVDTDCEISTTSPSSFPTSNAHTQSESGNRIPPRLRFWPNSYGLKHRLRSPSGEDRYIHRGDAPSFGRLELKRPTRVPP